MVELLESSDRSGGSATADAGDLSNNPTRIPAATPDTKMTTWDVRHTYYFLWPARARPQFLPDPALVSVIS
jgi:hypothetical protein